MRKKILLTVILIVLDAALLYSYYGIFYILWNNIVFLYMMFKASLFILSIELFLKKYSSWEKMVISLILMAVSSVMQILPAYKLFYPDDYAFMTVFSILFLTIPLLLYSIFLFIYGIIQKRKSVRST